MPESEQIQKSCKSKCVVETEITCLKGPELTSNCLVLLRQKSAATGITVGFLNVFQSGAIQAA